MPLHGDIMAINVTCSAQCLAKVGAQIETIINCYLSTGRGAPHPHLSSLFQQALGPGLPRAAPDSCHSCYFPPQVPEPRGMGPPWEGCWFQNQARSQSTFCKGGREWENLSAWHPERSPIHSHFPKAALMGREVSPRPSSAS